LVPLAAIFARTIAERVEISSEAASELGTVLVACELPPQMVGFIHFAGQLAKLLPALQERISLKHPLELTRGLSSIAAAASAAPDTFPLPWRRVPNTGSGDAQTRFARTLGGYYKTHPVYCAIWHGCVESLFVENFYALCAEVIVAGHELRAIDANNAVAASRRYEMGLLVRRLGAGETTASQAVLRDLPRPSAKGRDYAAELTAAWTRFKSNQPSESVVRLGPLIDLLARAVDKVSAQKRERQTAGGGRRGATVGLRAEHIGSDSVASFDAFEEYDPMGPPDDDGKQDAAISKRLSRERVTTFSGRTVSVTAYDIEGESTGETRSAGSVIRIASRRPADADDRLALLRLRGRLAAIAMQKQNLRTQWRGLTERECALFVSMIPKLANQVSTADSASGSAIREQCEAAIFLALLFITGFPPDQVGRARVAGKGQSGLLSEAPLWIDRRWQTLTIQVASPQSRDRARAPTNQDAENVEEQISFNVPAWLNNLARSAVPKDYGTSRSVARPLFRMPLPDLLSVAQRELVSLNRHMGTRITLDRVIRHRRLSITRFAAGDEVDAMFATWDQQWQRHNGTYYYARPTLQLAQILNNSLVNDFTESFGTIFTDARLSKADATPSVSAVGSQYCPKVSTVRRMVHGLQARVRESATRQSAATIPEIHRRYATYVQAFYSYATGLRGVSDPLRFETSVDPITGIAVISDKDTEDYYNTHIVWLPAELRQQLEEYKLHLDALQRYLAILDPTSAQARLLQVEPPVFPGVDRTAHQAHNKQRVPLLFSLTDTGGVRSLSSGEIKSRLADFSSLPVNANRHYLRSHLRRRGCPPEIVDAMLGHWQNGQEPWGGFSAMSPVHYSRVLSEYLPQLLADDGWTSITSPLLVLR
jgi:hypothetical protein